MYRFPVLMLVLVAVLTASIPALGQDTANEPVWVGWWVTGDSYTSGEGLRGASGECARSETAYAELVRDELQQRGWVIDPWAATACTGHLAGNLYNQTAPDMWGTPRPDPPRDVDSLWGEAGLDDEGPFGLVSLTIGGNDVDFGGVIADCAAIWMGRCSTTERALTRRIDDLTDPTDSRGRLIIDESRDIQGSMADLYAYIHDRHLSASNGHLVVIGYPRLFAPSGTWRLRTGFRCERVHWEDADMLGRVALHFDQTLHDQVRISREGGRNVHYISVLPSFSQGHELCGREEAWITGLADTFYECPPDHLRGGEICIRMERAFHPNELGHEAISRLFVDYLTGDDIDWNALRRPDPRQVDVDSLLRAEAELVNVSFARLTDGPTEDVVVWSQSQVVMSNMTARVHHVDVYSWHLGRWESIFNANEHQIDGHPLLEARPQTFAAQHARAVETIDFDGDGTSSLAMVVQSAGAVAASGDVWVIDLTGSEPRTEHFAQPLRSVSEAEAVDATIRIRGPYEHEYGAGGLSHQSFTFGWSGDRIDMLTHDIERVVTLRPDGLGLVRFGMDRDVVMTELTALLGAPTSVVHDSGGEMGAYERVEWGEHLTAVFSREQLETWYVESSRFATSTGVRVGMSLEETVSLDPNVVVESWGFTTGGDGPGSMCGFVSEAGIVTTMLAGVGCIAG